MRAKKRIVHVITGLERGGAETLLIQMVQALQNDYDQTILYFKDGPLAQQIPSGISALLVTGSLYIINPWVWWRCYRTIKKIKPDSIHSWLWSATIISRCIAAVLGIDHISSFHNNVEQNGTLRNLLDRYTMRYSKFLVPVCRGIAHSLCERDNKDYSSLVVINNGLNVTAVQDSIQQCVPHAFEKKQSTFVIGTIGRLVPVKNYDFLLRVFADVLAQYPDLHLVIVGTGPQEQYLKQRATTLAIDHAVTWAVNQAGVAWLRFFDCFVQPSLKEGLSMALLEAMSCSLPCVVTHPTPLHDVITHGHDGLVLPTNDHNALVQALITVVSHEILAAQLGKNAVQTVHNNFSFETMLYSYKRLYNQCENHIK